MFTPAENERQRYLLELLDTLAKTIERQAKRIQHETREDLNTLLLVLGELRAIRQELDRLNPPPPPPIRKPLTRSIAVQFSGDNTSMANNALVFNVGQTSTASIQPLLADGVTPSGGTLSNVSYSFSDPSATVVLNPDGVTATCTGVAASTGPVSGSATATVTDTDGVVTQFSQPFTITTNAATPAQLTQSIAVQFTAPVAAAA